MSDAEDRRFMVIQGPEDMTEEEYGNLAEAAQETLPDDVDCLILSGGIRFLERDELEDVLMDAVEYVRMDEEHRLAGAEPAEQPADPPWEDEDVEQFKEDMSEEDNE